MARLPNPNHYNHFGIYLKDVRKALRSDKGHRLLSKTPGLSAKGVFTQRYVVRRLNYLDDLGQPSASMAQYLSNIERGVEWPSVDFATELAQLYGVHPKTVYSFFMKKRSAELRGTIGLTDEDIDEGSDDLQIK